MKISLTTWGAGQEVGRSCIIVKINEYKVMFDCGAHMAFNDSRKFPDFRLLLNSDDKKSKKFEPTPVSNSIFKNWEDNKHDYSKVVDLLVISHFHLDHCASLPYFTELLGYKGPILCSQPTKAILPVTLEDFRKIMGEYRGEKSILSAEQIITCMNRIETIEINETKTFRNGKIKWTAFYAGHVLGAEMFLLDIDGYTVAYTGDYNTITDRHLSGAYMPKIYPDILMTETTYGDKVRDTKRVREREFLKKIQDTIDKGGKVLIPIFALGRAQELCIVLDTYWKRTNCTVPIYFAGPMAQKANFYYKLFQNWMNTTVKNIFTTNNVFDFKFVQQGDKTIMKKNKPMVIFATPGMLHGGHSWNIFKEIAPESKNCVIIPGYCSAGTVGNKILNGEKRIEIDNTMIDVNCEVYYMSFSAHADAKGWLQLIKNVQPRNVMLVHGDYEIMKYFKHTCEDVLEGTNIITPGNYEKIKFRDDPVYYQVNITKNVFDTIKIWYKMSKNIKKSNKPSRKLGVKANWISIRGWEQKGNSWDWKQYKWSEERIESILLKNRVKMKIGKSNIIDIFNEFIKGYYPIVYTHYTYLIALEYLIISQEGDFITFSFDYSPSNYDQQINYSKTMRIIKIFTRINKL